MNTLPSPLLIALSVISVLVAKSNGQLTTLTPYIESEAEQLVEELLQNDPNSSLIYDENGNPRDKRALGVLLQGLVQALGYNTTPVQLASLPNPNTVGTMASGPINLDIRQAASPATTLPPQPPSPQPAAPPPAAPPAAQVAAASSPRQRETLRFTGVVNFGNNSDILGHLRQYEQLFHGTTPAATTQQAPAAAAAAAAPAAAGSAMKAPALLDVRDALPEPYFVPIPIPLSPNIQNLGELKYPQPPRISFVTPNPTLTFATQPTLNVVTSEYRNKEHKETHKVENQEIIGDRNPNLDERRNNDLRIMENNRNREEEINQMNEARPSQYVSAEIEGNHSPEYNQEEESVNEDDAKELSPANQDQGGEVEDDESSKEQYQSNDEEEDKEYEDEDNSEESKSASQKSKQKSKLNQLPTEDAEHYVPNKYPNFYTMRLPVEEKPFHGPFMNSYGQSLEHGGKVDVSVADYFGKFKNAQSGLYDAQTIIAPAVQRRPWWLDGIPQDPIERLQIEPRFPLKNEYEDYIFKNLGEKNNEEEKDDVFKEESKQISTTYDDDETLAVESELIAQKQSQQVEKTSDKHKSKVLAAEPFDFVKFVPYYRPVQYFYSPASLEKSAQAILQIHHAAQKHKKKDENSGSGETEAVSSEEDEPAPQTVVTSTVKPEKITTKARKIKRPINKEDSTKLEKTQVELPHVTTESSKQPASTQRYSNSGEGSYEDTYANKTPDSAEDTSSGEDYYGSPHAEKDPKLAAETKKESQQKKNQDYPRRGDYADRSPASEYTSEYDSSETKYADDSKSKATKTPYTGEEYNDSVSYDRPDASEHSSFRNSHEDTKPVYEHLPSEQESQTAKNPSQYIATNSEVTERALVNEHAESNTQTIGSVLSTTPRGFYNEGGNTETNFYQVQETAPKGNQHENVPITTYDPVTYILRSGSPNIQYTYTDVEEANHPKVELQYHIPYEEPSYVTSEESVGAMAGYAFGRRIGQSSSEAQNNKGNYKESEKKQAGRSNKGRRNRLLIINTDPPVLKETTAQPPVTDNEFISANNEPTQTTPQRKVKRRGSRGRKHVGTSKS